MPLSLDHALPETQVAEKRLRSEAKRRWGISYVVRWEMPHLAAVRTPADTTQLLKWRDQAVAAAMAAAKKAGKTPAQVEAAGRGAYYRVSPFDQGFHGIGGAFDIYIDAASVGKSAEILKARKAGEDKRRASGGNAVQVKAAGDAAAIRRAYELVGSIAPAVGLRWGGTFSSPADPFHFELAQVRAVVAQKWAARTPKATGPGSTGGAVVFLLLAAGAGAAYLLTRGAGGA